MSGADKSLVTLTFSRRTDADEFAFSLELPRELHGESTATIAAPHNVECPVTPDMILREINDELNLASLSCIEGWCRATETMSRQVCVCVITFGCVCASQQQVSPVRC